MDAMTSKLRKLIELQEKKIFDSDVLEELIYAHEISIEVIELQIKALHECAGHFLSIKLNYGIDVGNTPKGIPKNALSSIKETLKQVNSKLRESIE